MRERDIFDAAQAIESDAERAAYLNQVCAGDTALRKHLEGLLKARGELGDFLEAPASARNVFINSRFFGYSDICMWEPCGYAHST